MTNIAVHRSIAWIVKRCIVFVKSFKEVFGIVFGQSECGESGGETQHGRIGMEKVVVALNVGGVDTSVEQEIGNLHGDGNRER